MFPHVTAVTRLGFAVSTCNVNSSECLNGLTKKLGSIEHFTITKCNNTTIIFQSNDSAILAMLRRTIYRKSRGKDIQSMSVLHEILKGRRVWTSQWRKSTTTFLMSPVLCVKVKAFATVLASVCFIALHMCSHVWVCVSLVFITIGTEVTGVPHPIVLIDVPI